MLIIIEALTVLYLQTSSLFRAVRKSDPYSEGPDTLLMEDLGLQNHIHHGFGDLIPELIYESRPCMG